ncbi:hypothetical protein [Pseudorhodoferax sp.]|uniref:hypothetical protein n=1 Tax=Pseudorhodoferax sp. TaxID=1993553 RepID=UPI0039E4A4B3
MLPTGIKRIRHYGVLAAACRGRNLAAAAGTCRCRRPAHRPSRRLETSSSVWRASMRCSARAASRARCAACRRWPRRSHCLGPPLHRGTTGGHLERRCADAWQRAAAAVQAGHCPCLRPGPGEASAVRWRQCRRAAHAAYAKWGMPGAAVVPIMARAVRGFAPSIPLWHTSATPCGPRFSPTRFI